MTKNKWKIRKTPLLALLCTIIFRFTDFARDPGLLTSQQATEQALAGIVQYCTTETTTVSNVGVEEQPQPRMWKMILIHIQLFCKSNYTPTPIQSIKPPPTHYDSMCAFLCCYVCGQLVRIIYYAAQQCNVTCEGIFLQ